MTLRASSSSSGRACSHASRGPEATIVSRPLAATFGLPLTGAASIAVPRRCAAARIVRRDRGEIVVESMIRPGATSARDSSPAAR